MIIEVKVPSPGESISEVQLADWLVEDGAYVEKDQEIAEIDSDKATLSISAEQSGTVSLLVKQGESIKVGSVVAKIETDGKAPAGKSAEKAVETDVEKPVEIRNDKSPAPAEKKVEEVHSASEQQVTEIKPHLSPLAKKLLETNHVNEQDFVELLRNYRFSKKDVEFLLEEKDKAKLPPASQLPRFPAVWGESRDSERKKMSTLRLKLAERLVAVKNETAMLTTFNEVNMTSIMKMREQYKDIFKEKHGVSLGFMSFFTKAVTEALLLFPQVNARIEGDEIVFHNFVDIGIAVSAPKGLIVPVLRNTQQMSLAEIEFNIKELATKARDNKISLDDMKGGTFTITNGGVFGSMLSTPILNPPQSAILGMHNIVDRPIAVNGQVEIHPIMYIALSYDHRIIDGRESVSFLVKVKEMLEEPGKMLFSGKDPVIELLGL
jgi:2-oxoglutarate dehydrogenase E2 component (dihydrolipoamide succinyltransferase)